LLQKNFCCTCVKSRHQYFINPLTEVQPVKAAVVSAAAEKKVRITKKRN
jgi:hypothetical protein